MTVTVTVDRSVEEFTAARAYPFRQAGRDALRHESAPRDAVGGQALAGAAGPPRFESFPVSGTG
jgi:hypothetical protein